MRGPTPGFTLVELIVVIVLMAILIGMAIPRFFGRGDFEAPSFARELASAARYAQKLAIVSGCRVDLTVTAGGYALYQPQPATPVCPATPTMTLPAMHPASGQPFAASVPTGVEIAGDLGTVVFRPSGIPDPATAYDFTIDTVTVSIAAGSGYVTVQ